MPTGSRKRVAELVEYLELPQEDRTFDPEAPGAFSGPVAMRDSIVGILHQIAPRFIFSKVRRDMDSAREIDMERCTVLVVLYAVALNQPYLDLLLDRGWAKITEEGGVEIRRCPCCNKTMFRDRASWLSKKGLLRNKYLNGILRHRLVRPLMGTGKVVIDEMAERYIKQAQQHVATFKEDLRYAYNLVDAKPNFDWLHDPNDLGRAVRLFYYPQWDTYDPETQAHLHEVIEQFRHCGDVDLLLNYLNEHELPTPPMFEDPERTQRVKSALAIHPEKLFVFPPEGHAHDHDGTE